MINILFNKIQKLIFCYYWLIFPKKIDKLNQNDLNFGRIDFVNYQKIRSYFFKSNFVKKYSSIETHSFDFLYFAKKLGGKSGIELSKEYQRKSERKKLAKEEKIATYLEFFSTFFCDPFVIKIKKEPISGIKIIAERIGKFI